MAREEGWEKSQKLQFDQNFQEASNFYWGHSLWSKCLKLWYKKRQWMFFQKILLLLLCSKPSLRKSLTESDNSGWWPCMYHFPFIQRWSSVRVGLCRARFDSTHHWRTLPRDQASSRLLAAGKRTKIGGNGRGHHQTSRRNRNFGTLSSITRGLVFNAQGWKAVSSCPVHLAWRAQRGIHL